MQVGIKKWIFVGSLSAKDAFFEGIRELASVEFVGQAASLSRRRVDEIIGAIKLLRPMKSRGDATPSVEEVLSLKSSLEDINAEILSLEKSLSLISSYGDFDLDKLIRVAKASHRRLLFFRSKRVIVDKGIIFVSRHLSFYYYTYIGGESFSDIEILQIDRSLSEIEVRLTSCKKQKSEIINHLQRLSAGGLEHLQGQLITMLDDRRMTLEKSKVVEFFDGSLFAVDAWIREDRVVDVKALVDSLPIFATRISIDNDDRIPTLLDNVGIDRLGEDLVHIYDTPSIGDGDPSRWVFISFIIFFGMIISDACYGIFFLSIYFLMKSYSKGYERALSFFKMLSLSTILWGVLSASYFGIEMSPNNFLHKVSIFYYLTLIEVSYHIREGTDTYREWIGKYPHLSEERDSKNFILKSLSTKDNSYELFNSLNSSHLMEISILVGIIHLSLAFLKNLHRSIDGLGWMISMWGGYLSLPHIIGAHTIVNYLYILDGSLSNLIGKYMIVGGVIFAIIAKVISSGISGFFSLFKVIEIFSDTLSYLRIYALGMASMVMGATFNLMGSEVNPLLAPFILVTGHMINAALGVMAGFIHGLRLNFLEWYRHCFEGGGYRFNPLRFIGK